jgi:hypothetical protein
VTVPKEPPKLDAHDRANELYWGSGRSVNQIADELDLSKGALYETIRPLPAGMACPECGLEVVHPNRTARDRGRVDCGACGWEGTEQEAVALATGDGAEPDRAPVRPDAPRVLGFDTVDDSDPADDYDDYDDIAPPPARAVEREVVGRRLIAGGALLGAAVGLALVIWARRR